MKKKRLDAITFDFDATFYNYPRMVIGLLHRFGPHTKLIYDLTKVRAELRKEGYIEDFPQRQVEAMAKRWGKSEDYTKKKLDRVVYQGWNSAFDKVKPDKGVFEMLDMVVANDIPISVVSDYPPKDKMEKMGFLRFPWVRIINCEDIGLLKPDPTGFKVAMKAMGSKPGNTLHVGDSLRYDIKGANDLGMTSVWFKRWWRRGNGTIVPDITFSNYHQFMDILEKDFGLKRK